jgi:Tol biopolymer transport system component
MTVAALGMTILLAPLPLGAQQREPVLKQVKVPHPYYWREMYVPQATSGPSAVTWSPDGQELIYSMQGSLWRQRLGTTEARQLTSGPRYDYQPDWSPDGRRVVYSSYDGEAIDLKVLDLESDEGRTLLANGGVNVEPKWSPEGRRIAFVSTAHEGRWHIFTANVTAHGLDSLTRVTEDNPSGLPRYYYSVYDHYVSPTWSPDGRELIFISNRGRIYGTGGVWRAAARPGATPRELHYEETTWKARPDWARDGRRVVYSSYHGRQWHQLWLLAADGGDPIPLTYGEFDATAPRWSPDGRRIAYISNESGNTSLWVVEIPGGRRTRIEARTQRYRAPVGKVALTIVDAGRVTPARISVQTADGRTFTPNDAWRHADEAFVRGEQRFEYGYFHSDGRDTVTVPAGRITIEVWRGPEYGVVRREIDIASGDVRPVRVALARVTTLRGWWGGDLHVHMNYGGAYRNTAARLTMQARAEGLHVVENLIVNKEQRIPDIAYWTPNSLSSSDFVLAYGQEFHTGLWGHVGLIGLREHYLFPDYAGYPRTALESLYPTNAVVADLARAQGALVGYVHPFDFRPDSSRVQGGVPYEFPVDVALGKVDYVEVMGYSDHLLTSEIWYRLLNCGFRIPAGAGTDAFPNFASLRGPPGLVRVYAKLDGPLSHRAWLASLKAGRTFVTNAPLLEFELGRKQIGDEIRLPAGTHTLRARLSLRSAVPVDHLELIRNGRVIVTIPASTSVDTTLAVEVSESGWYVLRARAQRPRLPVLDLYPFASTSPVYVQVGDNPVRSRADAEYFLAWISTMEATVRSNTRWNTPAERDATLHMIAAARAEFTRRAR